jgi:hypothetical protein
MNHFQLLQKKRNREELDLFHDPFKYIPSNNEDDVLMDGSPAKFLMRSLGEMDDDYLARLEEEDEHFQHFYKEYEDDDVLEDIANAPLHLPCEKHSTASHSAKTENCLEATPTVKFDSKFTPKISDLQQEHDVKFDFNEKKSETEILELEQSLLSASVQNTKLDGVQKAESQMLQVTALLSQFATLISEQQEEVQVIADSTKESRKNVDSGREKLVLATEQKTKRRHYFAWIIFIMALLLLFLNTIID